MSNDPSLLSLKSRLSSSDSESEVEVVKKKVVDDSYKAFILPQYQTLCDESFLQNTMHPQHTAAMTKEKLNEITKMIQQSQSQYGLNNKQQKESKQLKNENTILWLKKRYLECGNKKYFGDEEDVAQQRFIKSIYDNIIQYQNSTSEVGIQLNDFNRLLQQFDLPLSYQNLSRIYAICDQNRDSHLNLFEFTNMILSDQANKIYLSQFKKDNFSHKQAYTTTNQSQKHGSLSMAFRPASLTSPFRPTSLAALNIFISFRINHDFLTEFLYDTNFPVKEKSMGLIKMLNLIKVNGQQRIKNQFDKRIIRKLKMEQSEHLGFASPFHNQGGNNNSMKSISRSEVEEEREEDKEQEKNTDTLRITVSSAEESPMLPKIRMKRSEQTLGRINRRGFSELSNKKSKTEFEKQMDTIVQQACEQGTLFAINQFREKQDTLKELQLENASRLEQSISNKSILKSSLILPNIVSQNNFHSIQSNTNSNTENMKFHNLKYDNSISNFSNIQQPTVMSSTQQDNNNNNSILQNSHNNIPNHTNVNNINSYININSNINNSTLNNNTTFKKINQNTINSNNNNNNNLIQQKGYSKQMAFLMEKTMKEAQNSRQTQIAKRIMQIEDSLDIKSYRKKMEQIKEKTELRANFLTASLQSGNKKDILPNDI